MLRLAGDFTVRIYKVRKYMKFHIKLEFYFCIAYWVMRVAVI